MRTKVSYPIDDATIFKRRLLSWAQQYQEVTYLDSNGHTDPYGSFECLVACEAESSLRCGFQAAFPKLKSYLDEVRDWVFGYCAYDLKNDIEALSSNGADGLGFADLYFFQPKRIIRLNGNMAEYIYLDRYSEDIISDHACISSFLVPEDKPAQELSKIKMRIFKDAYFKKVQKFLQHIYRGDIYEANFCQEFYSENTVIDPLSVFFRLNEIARPPFGAYFKAGHLYALSSSPERFLKKTGTTLVSQPIKGTARRSTDPVIDRELKEVLAGDPKEKAENIMIVDLVRNDLSKHALKGSVKVKELCKVYSFIQVHQMISTVVAQVAEETHPVDIIKNAFPMGSMTGAPKLSAMRLIESLELTRRGLYSGAIGYFTPEKDFDFSVVIRSILYNEKKKYLSFSVGSAITAKALPDSEYEECLLKAKAMRSVLDEH
ncbi:MAG: anthranilate synthase component I family protein [Flavobacteriaceae bacterium]